MVSNHQLATLRAIYLIYKFHLTYYLDKFLFIFISQRIGAEGICELLL